MDVVELAVIYKDNAEKIDQDFGCGEKWLLTTLGQNSKLRKGEIGAMSVIPMPEEAKNEAMVGLGSRLLEFLEREVSEFVCDLEGRGVSPWEQEDSNTDPLIAGWVNLLTGSLSLAPHTAAIVAAIFAHRCGEPTASWGSIIEIEGACGEAEEEANPELITEKATLADRQMGLILGNRVGGFRESPTLIKVANDNFINDHIATIEIERSSNLQDPDNRRTKR